jgi:hypothetical protein
MLGRAGVLTGLLAVIAVACSSDLVELLPVGGGASTGGAGSAAGQDTVTSGAGTGGSSAAGMATQGGFAGAPQAGRGNGGNAGGGNGGSAGGACFGFGCAGESGFSGSFGAPYCGNGNSCEPCLNDTQCESEYDHCANNVCVQCATEGPSQCWHGMNCDVLVRRCAPACDSTSDCNEGGVCDVNQHTCVWCIENGDCQQDGLPGNVCYLHRCVDCAQDTDCMKQGRSGRCSGFRCVQCLTNEDCKDPERSHCNVPKGYCE